MRKKIVVIIIGRSINRSLRGDKLWSLLYRAAEEKIGRKFYVRYHCASGNYNTLIRYGDCV